MTRYAAYICAATRYAGSAWPGLAWPGLARSGHVAARLACHDSAVLEGMYGFCAVMGFACFFKGSE